MKNPGLGPALPTAKAEAMVQLPDVLLHLFSWLCHFTAEFEKKTKNPGIEPTSPTTKAETKVQLPDVLLCVFSWLCHLPAEFEQKRRIGN